MKLVRGMIVCLVMILITRFWMDAQEKVEIEGAITLGNTENNSPGPGTIRWTGSDVQGWNGSQWVSLTKGIAYSGEVTDVDGNMYPTIIIGTQEWMAENLRTSKYKDGNDIPHVTDNTSWKNLTTGAYCWYDNDQTLNIPFGKLYNWHAVNSSSELCPDGWHVPVDAEWTTLVEFLGGASSAGGAMKATGFKYWEFQNIGATNSSGFSGLPGIRDPDGDYPFLGFIGYWWSATDAGSNAGDVGLFYDGAAVNQASDDKNNGFWVRCLKD